jgi:ribA/ribD-fused uncharacterized protein
VSGAIVRFLGEHRFLSNFWPVVVIYEGQSYPSVEHAYQAAKTSDVEVRRRIARLISPAAAKATGGAIALRLNWEQVRLHVMEDLLRLKFAHPDLREKLLATGDRDLVEGNSWGDGYWGVCRGVGENHLGKLLMKIRAELSSGR